MTRANNTDLKDVWQTPDQIVEMLRPIDLDPCAGLDSEIGDINYRNESVDGLEAEWSGRVFVNPPFSNKAEWLAKTIDERDKGNIECAFVLTPDGTDTLSWWHEYIAAEADYIWFSEGRVSYVVPAARSHLFDKYEGGETADNPTFGTAISIFGEPGDETLERMNENGQLLQTVSL